MSSSPLSLKTIFSGWETYQASLVHAVAPLSPEQLAFRPVPRLRSVGELVGHIALGRVDWFNRMGAPSAEEVVRRLAYAGAPHGDIAIESAHLAASAPELVRLLEISWHAIQAVLDQWTSDDLSVTYRFVYQGMAYAISRQWTIWRILTHDVHHGGELSLLLGLQGISVPELGDQFGHLVEPPLAAE